MDIMKQFLDNVTTSAGYSYEKVDTLAEIHQPGDIMPLALVEYSESLKNFIVRFRIGITSLDIANLARCITMANSDVIFDEDFIVDPDYGYLYGEEATQAFINRIQNNIQEAQFADAMEDAMFVSDTPIFAAGSGMIGKTKLEKIWDVDDY